jgi:two-component system sensor histidine kinase HydH
LLRRFEPRDDRARFVQVILDEVARLDRIVTSLLQYARPRSPELKPVLLGACVERVLQLMADRFDQARVETELDVAPRLRPVYIDADLVTQVLLNVTLNAIQAMPRGGRLHYEVRRVRRRGPPRGPGRRVSDAAAPGRGPRAWIEYQQVRVIDTGSGIPRGDLAKLFDPFFSTRPGGTGLGLSISQTIMQEHGGSIAVDSREGRGTTVLLNFRVEKRHGERRRADADA